jgi:hypothetical protein
LDGCWNVGSRREGKKSLIHTGSKFLMVAITDCFALILFVSQSYSKGGGLVLAEGKKKFIGSVEID